MTKKTITDLETGTFEGMPSDSTGEEVSHNSETITGGNAVTVASNTSSSKRKRSINILAKFGFRKKKNKNIGEASRSKSEVTPLLETKMSPRQVPFVSFSKNEENHSKQSVCSIASSSASSGKSWNKLKARLNNGDFLVQRASQPPSTTDSTNNNNNTGDRAIMVQEAMAQIRSGMEFSLTHCLIAILMYLMLAIICYHTIFQPEWTVIDSCYFAVTTFTTVGYGDLFPRTEASMMFTCLYALTGVACLGIALGILGSNLIEAQEKALSTAGELSKYQVLSVFDASQSGGGKQYQEQKNKLQEHASKGSASGACMGFLLHVIPLVCVMLGLAFGIGKESGWDTPKTIYYLVITASTIGYGDLTPHTQTGRFIAIFFIPIACGAMGQWLGFVANWIIEGRQAKFRKHLGNRELTQRDLDIMDENGDGSVSRSEFLEFMLVAMNKIDQELVDELRGHFDKLDADGTGELSREDLVEAARRRLKSPSHKLKLATYKHQLLEKGAGGPVEDGDGIWGRIKRRSSFFQSQ